MGIKQEDRNAYGSLGNWGGGVAGIGGLISGSSTNHTFLF